MRIDELAIRGKLDMVPTTVKNNFFRRGVSILMTGDVEVIVHERTFEVLAVYINEDAYVHEDYIDKHEELYAADLNHYDLAEINSLLSNQNDPDDDYDDDDEDDYDYSNSDR